MEKNPREVFGMSISTTNFGKTAKGETVTRYTLTNRSGSSVSILDFGGIVQSIIVPDKSGDLDDVALGFDDVATYEGPSSGHMGMLIGRVGNRIANAQFTLDGKVYHLTANNGRNNLHGGPVGFGKRMWQAQPVEQGESGDSLILTLVSEDGDQGFPGRLDVKVTYTFTKEDDLIIHYEAETDRPTIINLTNHTYFNLFGHDVCDIRDMVLQIFAEKVTDVGQDLIPTGELVDATEDAWDFTKPRRLGNTISLSKANLRLLGAGGVDFNYCVGDNGKMKQVAVLTARKFVGRYMEVYSDQPGVQCYTAQGLNVKGKDNVEYVPYSGVCLETQHYPDAVHHPNFPSIVLRPGEKYDTTTIYKFRVHRNADTDPREIQRRLKKNAIINSMRTPKYD